MLSPKSALGHLSALQQLTLTHIRAAASPAATLAHCVGHTQNRLMISSVAQSVTRASPTSPNAHGVRTRLWVRLFGRALDRTRAKRRRAKRRRAERRAKRARAKRRVQTRIMAAERRHRHQGHQAPLVTPAMTRATQTTHRLERGRSSELVTQVESTCVSSVAASASPSAAPRPLMCLECTASRRFRQISAQ